MRHAALEKLDRAAAFDRAAGDPGMQLVHGHRAVVQAKAGLELVDRRNPGLATAYAPDLDSAIGAGVGHGARDVHGKLGAFRQRADLEG